MSDTPQEIFLKDYTPPSHLIEKTYLVFDLKAEDEVEIMARLSIIPNPKSATTNKLVLNGSEKMELLSIALEGGVPPYKREGDTLIIDKTPNAPFTLETKVRINPKANKSLNGLYTSGGKFTTQCESEGFRNITFFLDRPDVMSEFTTKIIGDRSKYPQLLCNGNETEHTEKYSLWHDPFKKPAYLFALVAGNLDVLDDSFTTISGRKVHLQIFVDKGDLNKTHHAMASLKRSMKWDEERFGREYDLDRFMIVAVDDFNFGAMENKGLNIFNSSAILADPQTATDTRHEYIEAVVGHEYFHNWSGNRVTLRDWFQLSLKEGFTVFRDQEFSSDMNSRAVQRIHNVAGLRASQFPEDAGPMAHPIRPASFVTIENFYTATVYNKGSEVIRMMHTILGEENFRKGTDLYFDRHDGQAVTTEDFVKALEEASGENLRQFEKTWYNQSGTPELHVTDEYDASKQLYKLNIRQTTPATPGQPTKEPFHIPVKFGLLNGQGEEIRLPHSDILNITQTEQSFVFEGIVGKPVPSLLRGFSAPAKLFYPYTRANYTFLLAHDTDGFNRWEAAQCLAVDVMKELVANPSAQIDHTIIEAFRKVILDDTIDGSIKAALLTLPSETYLAEQYPAGQVDVDAIHLARNTLRISIANALEHELLASYKNNLSSNSRPYDYNIKDIAERAIRNTSLAYLCLLPQHLPLAQAQLDAHHNMTDVQTALTLLVNYGGEATRKAALKAFYDKWKHDTQVVNQWLSVQAAADVDDVLDQVQELLKHEAYDKTNPNKVRSVVGAFAGNRVHFHRKDGAGYRFLSDQVIDIDAFNPQLASRLVTPLTTPHKFDTARQRLILAELERIMAHGGLSKNTSEVVGKSLEMARKREKEAA